MSARKATSSGAMSQTTVLGLVVAGLLAVFALINGVPWAGKPEVAKLEAEVSALRSEVGTLRSDISESKVRIAGHDGVIAEVKAAITQMNAKLDALLQRR